MSNRAHKERSPPSTLNSDEGDEPALLVEINGEEAWRDAAQKGNSCFRRQFEINMSDTEWLDKQERIDAEDEGAQLERTGRKLPSGVKRRAGSGRAKRKPADSVQNGEEYEVKKIVGKRYSGENNCYMYKVVWKGYPERTWEPEEHLNVCCYHWAGDLINLTSPTCVSHLFQNCTEAIEKFNKIRRQKKAPKFNRRGEVVHDLDSDDLDYYEEGKEATPKPEFEDNDHYETGIPPEERDRKWAVKSIIKHRHIGVNRMPEYLVKWAPEWIPSNILGSLKWPWKVKRGMKSTVRRHRATGRREYLVEWIPSWEPEDFLTHWQIECYWLARRMAIKR